MKLFQIVNAIPSFNKVGNCNIKITLAYKLQKLLAKMQTEVEFFKNKHNEIILKYGEGDECIVPEDKIPLVEAEVMDIMNMEVDVEFEKVKLPLSDDIVLSANDVAHLKPFVEFVEKE